MGYFANAPLSTIEEFLDGMKYGELDMDDALDILLVLVKHVRQNELHAANAADVASCLANGIQPD